MSKKTEKSAINAVEDILENSNIIEAYISENDKTPFWDGHLFIYKKPNNNYDNRNEDFLGRIPVQVKGETVKNHSLDFKNFYFTRNDLNAYMQDGGIILFIVEIDNNKQKKVFYLSLLPVDIRKELQKDKSKNNILIKLKHINNSQINDFEDLCFNFLTNREKQFGRTDISLSISEAKQLMIFGSFKNCTLEQFLLKHSSYLYGKRNETDPIPLPIESINIVQINKLINRKVSISGKIYFNDFRHEQNTKYQELIFDDKIILHLEDKNTFITYGFHDNFEKRLNSTEFYKKFIETEGFKVSDVSFRFTGFQKDNELIKNIVDTYGILKDIAKLLDIFNIEYSKLDLKGITEEEYDIMIYLINTMVYNKKITDIEGVPGKRIAKIGNLNLLTFIYKNSSGKVLIENFGKLSIDIQIKAEKNEELMIYKADPFVLLSTEDILTSSNLDVKRILDKIHNYTFNEHYEILMIELLLKIIEAFDKTQNENFFHTSIGICDWLLKHNSESPIHILNKYQLIRRKRELNFDEKKILENVLKNELNSDDYLTIACGVYIILAKLDEFEQNFNLLTKEKKDIFLSFPIYNLYKSLSIK